MGEIAKRKDDDDEAGGDHMEPTGIGAAAGLGNALVKSGPFDKLLGPLAEFYGQSLLDGAQQRAERKKEKRRINAEKHLNAVFFSSAGEKLRSQFNRVQDEDSFEEWITGVGDVDPDDLELSELWQATLLAIGQKPKGKRLLEIVRKLSSEDAETFVHIIEKFRSDRIAFGIHHSGHPDRLALSRLRSFGLLAPISDRVINLAPAVGFILVLALYAATSLNSHAGTVALNNAMGPIISDLVSSITWPMFFFVALLILYTIYIIARQPTLTTEGRNLMMLTRELKRSA